MQTQRNVEQTLGDHCENFTWLGEPATELRFEVSIPREGTIVRPLHVSSLILKYEKEKFFVTDGTIRFGRVSGSIEREKRREIRGEVSEVFQSSVNQNEYPRVTEKAKVEDAGFLHAVFGRGMSVNGDKVEIAVEDFAGWLCAVKKDFIENLESTDYAPTSHSRDE